MVVYEERRCGLTMQFSCARAGSWEHLLETSILNGEAKATGSQPIFGSMDPKVVGNFGEGWYIKNNAHTRKTRYFSWMHAIKNC